VLLRELIGQREDYKPDDVDGTQDDASNDPRKGAAGDAASSCETTRDDSGNRKGKRRGEVNCCGQDISRRLDDVQEGRDRQVQGRPDAEHADDGHKGDRDDRTE